jgi:DeoR family transcriptional regulator of aga operon
LHLFVHEWCRDKVVPHLLNPERQERMLRFIDDHRQATVAELAKLFAVSEATVRRDLDDLESRGRVRRAHGGAVSIHTRALAPPAIQRMSEQAEEKRSISRAAADLVQDGETVFLGMGTTALEVARALARRRGLTVITNALHVVNLLAGRPDITVIVLGGLLRHAELSTIGYLAERTLQDLRADKAIMGVAAISVEEGVTANYLPELNATRAVIDLSRQVIVVADHTKLGEVSTVSVAPISAVDVLVTDDGAPAEQVEALRSAGVKVIVAP